MQSDCICDYCEKKCKSNSMAWLRCVIDSYKHFKGIHVDSHKEWKEKRDEFNE